ncbi:MAG TPA: hypothetical protein VF983_16500 [Streptosporangiaceae bacterium]
MAVLVEAYRCPKAGRGLLACPGEPIYLGYRHQYLGLTQNWRGEAAGVYQGPLHLALYL